MTIFELAVTYVGPFLGAVFGAFLFSYLKNKGKNLATRQDIDLILETLKRTTEATEKIKIGLDDASWSMRSETLLRRDRLEEYLGEAKKYVVFHQEYCTKMLYDEHHPLSDDLDYVTALGRAKTVATLYFPSLVLLTIRLETAGIGYERFCLTHRANGATQPSRPDLEKNYSEYKTLTNSCMSLIETSTKDTFKEIVSQMDKS